MKGQKLIGSDSRDPVTTYARHVVIYALCDSRIANPVGRVRYVGQTHVSVERRLRQHQYEALQGDKTHRSKWMRAVYAAGGDVIAEQVTAVSADSGNTAEIDAIARYRALGCRLTNGTDGGRGWLNPSPETLANMRAWRFGNAHCVGRKLSPETRAKIAASSRQRRMLPHVRLALARTRPQWGPIAAAKQSAAIRGRRISNSHKEHHGKLTWAVVKQIRARHSAGEATPRQLAQEYAVFRGTIYGILQGRSWVAA